MAEILSLKTRFKGKSSKKNIFKQLSAWFFSLDGFTQFSLLTLMLVIFGIGVSAHKIYNTRSSAATTKTATISISPSSGSYTLGQQVTVNMIVDGGGQAFNAAQATVGVSSNFTIQSLTIVPTTSGGCGFTFANTKATPTVISPSFAGAVLNGFVAQSCTLYTMVLQVNAIGTGTITLTKGSVKAYVNSAEILLSTQSGSYTLGSAPTPTPTPLPPTATPTPLPPTSTPSPTPIVATPTPTPTASPLQPPTIDTQPAATYATGLVLTGTKTTSTVTVVVNGTATQTTYPTTTTWQSPVSLTISQPNAAAIATIFTVYGIDGTGKQSLPVTVSIANHRLGDINGDGIIDLTDLSLFGTDWENTSTLNNPLSDMNGDGVIDLTDFSILAKAYGN